MVAANDRTAVAFSLSPRQAHDAPEERELLKRLGRRHDGPGLAMDRAYEGDGTRQLALELGWAPAVPAVTSENRPMGA